MKPFAKVILSFIALLPMAVMADESPNSAFKELINIRETHLNNASQDNIDSYYFLYGLALKNDDLVNTGRAYFKNENLLSQSSIPDKQKSKMYEQLDQEYPYFGILDVLTQYELEPNYEIYCVRLNGQSCFEKVIKNKTYWQSEINNNSQLFNRYQDFLTRKPAVTPHLMTNSSPVPNYRALLIAQRLTHLSYLLNPNQKINSLLNNELIALKEQLAQADNLLQKIFIQRMIVNNLQIKVILKTKFNMDFDTPIANLTDNEKSLRLALTYEFSGQENLYKSLMQGEKHYKHYTTYNGVAKYFLNQIELSEKAGIEIGNYQANFKEQENPIKVSKKGNKIGFMFANLAVINYVDYAQKINEIDNIINMTNYILTGNDSYLINVFTDDNKGIVKDNEKICMPLPKADNDRTQTCLYL